MKKKFIRPFLNVVSNSILIIIAIFIFVEYYCNNIDLSINQMSMISVVVILFSYLKILSQKNYKILGFHIIILTYTFLSHFGSIIAFSLENSDSFIRSTYSMRYLFMPELETAVLTSLFACILYVLAANKIDGFSNLSKMSSIGKKGIERNFKFDNAVFIIGISILMIGLLLMLKMLLSGYLNITYSQRNTTLNSIWWYGHIIIILVPYAFTMMMAVLPLKKWLYGLVLFSLIGIGHFALGNRGEVLYSAITCLSVYYLRYRKINKKFLIVAIFAFIFVIPFIRDFRVNSLLNNYSFDFYQNIIELISELGFQIAPFTYTVQIVEEGVGYQYGGTYLYSFADFIFRKVPFIPQVPVESTFNIKYMMPDKGLGFTHIGEAFYNFGFIGAGIYYIIFSKFLLKLESIFIDIKTSKYTKIFCALIVVEFVNLTRNSFCTFPVYFTYIFVFLSLIYISLNLKR